MIKQTDLTEFADILALGFKPSKSFHIEKKPRRKRVAKKASAPSKIPADPHYAALDETNESHLYITSGSRPHREFKLFGLPKEWDTLAVFNGPNGFLVVDGNGRGHKRTRTTSQGRSDFGTAQDVIDAAANLGICVDVPNWCVIILSHEKRNNGVFYKFKGIKAY